MRQRELIAESTTPDGDLLTLTKEQGEHVVRVRGETLMSSQLSGSEQAMAKLAFDSAVLDDQARILIGGLGMGFTLRAVLDQAGPRVRIAVVELFAEVVAWNRGPLAYCAQHALDDPRVSVSVGDLLEYLQDSALGYNAILLDIDNGPEAFTIARNDRVYGDDGLAIVRNALADNGVMVLWSAFRSPSFEKRLRRAGFTARSVTARARADVGKGARHTLFVACKDSDPRSHARAAKARSAKARPVQSRPRRAR